ncbi:MAG: oligopeptidase [Gammaproteobacteria bacterium]|jgi:oligopeptidase A|nr:oligopeptidase [Gammaproteobacteria bacterium]
MQNPLLQATALPLFNQIKTEHIEPALDKVLTENRQQLKVLLAQKPPFTWENLIQPLEEMSEKLGNMWSPVSHLHSVVSSDDLRKAYNACLPKLTEYSTEIGQNEALYQAIASLVENGEYQKLELAQRKIIDNELRDFRLAGVALSADKKKRYQQLQQRLAELSTKFEEHLLDATDAWQKPISDKKQLQGLPERALAAAQEAAKRHDKTGWLLTLDFPSYDAVIRYADNRELRQEIYTAYTTRASDQGPLAGQYDNSTIMDEIITLRHELAELLGFDNFAKYSLATKMAKTPQQVTDFLYDLAQRARPAAIADYQALCQMAKDEFGATEVQAWDIAYYSEKLRKLLYDIAEEEIREYFPLNKVLAGLFSLVGQLYGISITRTENTDVWHPEVQFFSLHNAQNELIGQFYLDLYARPQKRGGAWMDDCRGRYRNIKGKLQIPVAYLTCNFSAPTQNKPALLTHDEVITLFHEFGHGLHHLLTKIDYPGVAGINGVPWDAVEFPSQFMENWCWHKESLDLMAAHYKTNQPMPAELLERMQEAKNFQAGMQMIRQLEFSLFDFRLHLEFNPQQGAHIQQILNEVRKQIGVVPVPGFNRFQHSFGHIFGGGYAAGYYSYKWAEVLACDAFGKFLENGILDPKTGQAFLHNILEQGGSRDPMDLFKAFMGREPKIDALLRDYGLVE